MNDDLRSDDELEQAVALAFASVPPVPADLSEFARGVVDWAHLDAELARMTFDSGLERSDGLRSDGGNERMLSYAGGELEIELALLVDTVIGQVTPPAGYKVELQTPSGKSETTTDGRGRFRLPPIRLPARLVVSSLGGRVVTPWHTA
jgi:hypothetical protein